MARLETCNQNIQRVFLGVVKILDCSILVGRRGQEEQFAAFNSGASQLPWPESEHNAIEPDLSDAVDVAPCPLPKDWGEKNRDEYEKFRYFAFFVIGYAAGLGITLRWGGDWNMDGDVLDNKFEDLLHFEEVK